MRTSPVRKRGAVRGAAAALAGLLALVGCSDSGGPTEPRSEAAVVQGRVAEGNGATVEPAGAFAATGTIEIRVKGTDRATTAAGDGTFALAGVPTGNQTIQFVTASGTAEVPLPEVLPSETITMDVTTNGNSARVNSMERSGGSGELRLAIDPDHWNLEWSASAGQVTAFIRGEGIDTIDLSSIVLLGDDPAAAPLAPIRATREGEHVKAQFAKSEAIDRILDPVVGTVHTVSLRFQLAGVETTLTDEITIVGGDDGDGDDDGPLRVEIQPDHWNTNYPDSEGWVTVFIRGEGNDDVALSSVVMVGDLASAEPLPAASATREGNHVRAHFPKSRVLSILDNPVAGSVHEVTIRFDLDGAGTERTDRVTIVGP